MRFFYGLVLLLLTYFISNKNISPKTFESVDIEVIREDSLLNIRAIEYVKELNTLIYLTSDGRLGILSELKMNLPKDYPKPKEETYLKKINDSLTPNFRALSARERHGFGISIGNPAAVYKLDFDNDSTVYQENHPKVFYDSMEFWNDDEGIAIGDPTDDCMSIIITRDGGNSWQKLSCDQLPKAKEGEAAFAASDTNIAIVEDHTWVATGGKASRILYSPDKGKSWKVYDTPIIQGKETTGIYSVDFYDENNGFAIGGDYTKPNDTYNNKIRTDDGGKTWEVVANNQSPGYRSCIQYVPNSNTKGLVAIGYKGIDYSADAGETWTHLSDEGFYTIRFIDDSTAYAAGKGQIAKLSFN